MHPMILGNKFYWNIDQSVGRNASNSDSVDISLVQWSFVLATSHDHGIPADGLQLYRAVQVTGFCNGRDDDPLVRAILAMQKNVHARHPASTIDGHISVAYGDGRYAPGTAFLILDICYAFAHWFPNAYPRLDLVPGCPSAIIRSVRGAIPGT